MGATEDWTDELVGLDGSLATAYERVKTAGASGCATALWGERGVGKETFARLIAYCARRPFFHLRASQLTAERWRELGTSAETPFCGGVLYLSEFETQGARESRRFAEIAASGRLNFQIVVGTTLSYEAWRGSRTPSELALASGFPIRLPPLRERLAEVPELARRFFADASRRLGVWREPLKEREFDELGRACVTGNLDELRARIERVVASDVFSTDSFDASSFVPKQTASRIESTAAARAPDEKEPNAPFLTLDEAMKAHIEEALRRSHGAVEGKRGAAAWLAINPYTLRARMRKLGIDWTLFRPDRATDDDL